MRFVILSAIAAAVLANPILTTGDNNAPIPGYTVEYLQWEIEVSPGQKHLLNGTVQEVMAQAIAINPAFKLVERNPANAKDSSIVKRGDKICNNFPQGKKGPLQDGVNYLRGLNGMPTNGPGPGACGRVSCSYASAIWWCNDNTTPKTLDDWEYVANSAQDILNTCPPTYMYGNVYVSGQNFEMGNWNTIVRDGDC